MWTFRYCPVKYHPFDPLIPDKYVVGDDYLPTWKVPPLIPYYTKGGFSMKEAFDAHMKDLGKVCLFAPNSSYTRNWT